MTRRWSESGSVVRVRSALLVVVLVSGACGESGGDGSPTAPPLPPSAPSATRVAGTMIDPKSDTPIGTSSFEYTNPDGSAGRFSGASFDFEIRPGTTVAVSAPDYESRTIGSTPDSSADGYFLRYTGDARFSERFKDVALSTGGSTQRMAGSCLRGEAPTPLEVQVAAPGGYGSSIRAVLPDLTTFTRGAYDVADAPFGDTQSWSPQSGVLKIWIASSFYQQPCYPAISCTIPIGNPPQILGASIVVAGDRAGKGAFFQHLLSTGLAFVAGARGYTDSGGLMTPSSSKPIDKYDRWLFNTLYCLPIGYTPGSLTAASSAVTALPFAFDPDGPATFNRPGGIPARRADRGGQPSAERHRPPER
jgi:hypothetical protein